MSGARYVTSVRAANRMAAQWARTCPDASSVFCAPSAWPLLALLADSADGPGREELEEAVGLSGSDSRAAALELLTLLRGMTAVRSALGIWVSERFPLEPAWRSGLPLGAVGLLTGDPAVDAPLLDDWVQQNTDGLVDRLPVGVTDQTAVLLAAAMSVRTRWVRPFTDWGWPITYDAGPWKERRYHPLSRVSRIMDRVSVTPTKYGEITCLEVLGHEGITVHLVIGEEGRSAGEVLQGGLSARTGWERELGRTPGRAAGGTRARTGEALQVGDTAPGLLVERVPDDDPDDRLLVLVPRFRVEGDHDLLKQPKVFGLDTVTDTSRGHFPAISAEPLAVTQAKQSAVAMFTADGFEAAAVTAIGAMGAGIPPVLRRRVKQIRVEFDRPFGFVASHRTSGLILAVGWVAEPEAYSPTEQDLEFEALFGTHGEEL